MPVDFAGQVQPIFAAHCYACHGPDKQESNFRLDVRATALGKADSGPPPIVPGKSDASPLIRFVSGADEDHVMPPPGEGKRLSADQIAILRRWIDRGANWPDELAGRGDLSLTTDHWSFQPVAEVTPPNIESDWIRNSIDAFVLEKLRSHGLKPSSAADPITLIRRIYLDMHGLPPTGRQVREFVTDPSNRAYTRVIDQVLESSHYGERWARHWLDVARFGESTGYEVNQVRENAYYYRDYVIESLNDDKSYRDFVIEQIAGDAREVDAATGFLVGGPHDGVTSPDVNLTLMQREDKLADYVNTTATAFLGLTIGCARCHNHKFDPILQKDYYAMQAIFAGVQHGERELRGDGGGEARRRLDTLQHELEKQEQALARFKASAIGPAAGHSLSPVTFGLNVDAFPPIEAQYVRFTVHATTGGEPCIDELEIFSTDDVNVALATAGAVATASGTLPGYEIHKLTHINDSKIGNSHSWISSTSGRGWVQIKLAAPTKIERIQWGRDRNGAFKDRLATSYAVEVAVKPGQWKTIATSEAREPFAGGDEREDAFLARLPADEAKLARETLTRVQQIRGKLAEALKGIPKAYVGTFIQPETTYRLYRGDPFAPREEVAPDALTVLGTLGLNSSTPEQERRLALARWIASPDNPLTARVIVNRVWHYHFGVGLVSTPSDFGKNGTPPSHPELLDWMAQQFMDNGWSLKWLHREILTSQTYQQSSAPRADAAAKDADSRLLWRFPPRRLEAEAIRDCILRVSGALNPQAGGPGFLLFQVDGHETVHHYFPLEKFGPNEFRRMIYMTKIRQEQDEVFGVFDCPDGGQTIPNRSRSTTPLQALNLLNSRFMLQQTEILAVRVRQEAGADVAAQVKRVFQLAFSRPPDAVELEQSVALVKEYGLDALCRAIFNANEFLFLS
ncbi:DUF1553 domain-containing protein [Pirellulales bacterium]|nr:DUF1553 domain-containing protein [Pirellulales bacterium]